MKDSAKEEERRGEITGHLENGDTSVDYCDSLCDAPAIRYGYSESSSEGLGGTSYGPGKNIFTSVHFWISTDPMHV